MAHSLGWDPLTSPVTGHQRVCLCAMPCNANQSALLCNRPSFGDANEAEVVTRNMDGTTKHSKRLIFTEKQTDNRRTKACRADVVTSPRGKPEKHRIWAIGRRRTYVFLGNATTPLDADVHFHAFSLSGRERHRLFSTFPVHLRSPFQAAHRSEASA